MAGINSLPTSVTHASGQATSSGTRARHTATAGPSTAAPTPADAARQQAINNIATQLHHYFPGGGDLNHLVQDRASELHEMGETAEDVAATMAKGLKMDNISEAVGSAVKAFPFSISGYPAGAIKLGANIAGASMKSEGQGAAIDGATAMVLKSVGDKVFAPVVKDSLWMAADAEKLEPEMQEMLKKRQGLGESLRLAPLGSQGFNGRNAVVGTVATLTHNNPQAVSHTSNVLSLAAGAAGGVLTNKFSASHGPEYLLGRTDWKAQYVALKNTSVKQQMSSGGAERLKTLLVSVAKPSNYAKGVLNVVSGNMLAEIGALALGLGLNAAVRYAARNTGVGEAVSSASSAAIDELTNRLGAGDLTNMKDIAADQAINLVGAGLAYAFQGVAGALAGPAPTRNDEAVDHLADKVVNSVLGQKTGEIRDKSVDVVQRGAKATGQFTVETAVATKSQFIKKANAFADGAVKTGNAVGSGLSSAKSSVSGTMSNARQWTSEQVRQRLTSSSQPGQAMPATAGQTVAPTAPQPTLQASSQPSAPAMPQPTFQASTSRPAAPPPSAAQASASQATPQTRPQPSASQTTAQARPQPSAQSSPSQPAVQTASSSATPGSSRTAAQPAGENIEMQPLGKSKQA